jgi:hypothetical protein
VKKPYTGHVQVGAIAWRAFQRRCRAFRTVARHPRRHAVDHGTLVAGSQVPGLSTTFPGKRSLLQNFPSGKERKVFNFLEGKLSPTNAKDEKSRGKVEAQVVESRDEVENQVLKSRKEVEVRARAPAASSSWSTSAATRGADNSPLFPDPHADTAPDTLVQGCSIQRPSRPTIPRSVC